MSNDFDGTLGVILANSTVPRVPGEVGDRASMPGGTLYATTCFGDFLREMREGLLPSSLAGLRGCRDALVERGADRIATSCGLLWPYQASLQAGCPVPFVSSALCLLDRLVREYPGGVCVVTVEASFLPFWRRSIGPRLNGVPFCALGVDHYVYQALTGAVPCDEFSPDIAQAAVIETIAGFLARRDRIAAILLECTNLSPYKRGIEQAFGLPVFDIFSAIGHSK